MTYAKNKTTQAEFVKAWWEKADKKAEAFLQKECPGIGISLFNVATYKDKLAAIPNNVLRRAGLKPIRRNGKTWFCRRAA